MKKEMLMALAEYGKTVKRDGWEAGEPVILAMEKRFPDFRCWAYALGIMLRAEELVEEGRIYGNHDSKG